MNSSSFFAHRCLGQDPTNTTQQGCDAAAMLAVRPAAKLLWTLVFCVCPAGMYLSNFIRGVEVLAIEVDDRANA